MFNNYLILDFSLTAKTDTALGEVQYDERRRLVKFVKIYTYYQEPLLQFLALYTVNDIKLMTSNKIRKLNQDFFVT